MALDPTEKQPAQRIVIQPSQDPLWEERERSRTNVRQLAWLMDTAFVIPGTKFHVGLDAVIGLIPFFGDLIGMAVSSYLVMIAARLGVPRSVIMRMLLNMGADVVLGIIPVAGDLLDAAWRANSRNAALLERALNDPKGTGRSSVWVLVGLGVLLLAMLGGTLALTLWVFRLIFS